MNACTTLTRRLWVARYELEELRALHAKRRRYMRSAACCVGLAALNIFQH